MQELLQSQDVIGAAFIAAVCFMVLLAGLAGK
jgi:hypothetical protein